MIVIMPLDLPQGWRGSHLTLTPAAHCNSGGNKIYQIYKRITGQCNSGSSGSPGSNGINLAGL